ncbi:response regulator transcription factor [Kitasatospora sp. NPDC096147]|uniref:response regulator transcription factor n=1 Tax=Kitasatospora sp. NPDC096147 TaxID=3364093 RepID=UPI003821793B
MRELTTGQGRARGAEGRSNEEIAREFVVSPATVCTHVSRAMAKLGATDRAQLVVHAYRSGLVEPGTHRT